MAQINYVSRNQLHSTANLNFGLMCKKEKHCWAFSANFSVQFSWLFFPDHVLLLAELAQKFKLFKIAVWRSDSMKRNLGGFTFHSFSCQAKLKKIYPQHWITDIYKEACTLAATCYRLFKLFFCRLKIHNKLFLKLFVSVKNTLIKAEYNWWYIVY